MAALISQRFKFFLMGVLIASVFIMLVLSDIHPPSELKTRDLRFLIRGKEEAGDNVAIVAIDDKSLEAVGRWPWHRSVIADLITLLKQSGANVIAIDLLFSEPETNPETQKIHDLITDYTRLGLLSATPESQKFFSRMVEVAESVDHDAALAETIRSAKNVILPIVFNVPAGSIPNETSDTILPIPILANAASRLGFVNVMPDTDGAVRQGLSIVRKDEKIHLSFSIRAVQKYLKIKHKDIVITPEKEIRLNSYAIPIDDNGIFYINYYGSSNHIPSYSCTDVLEGRIDPKEFDGKIVFIGSSATGLGDHWANPFDASFSGVETHATIADNILTKRLLSRPSWAKYIDALILILTGIILSMLLAKIQMRHFAPVSIGLIFALILINQIFFQYFQMILLWLYPILNIVMITLGIFVQRYLTEGREKKLLKQALQSYLNPSVVDQIIERPESLKLGGEKKELTVLFSDIRGFTAISESLSPEKLVRFMNHYLTAMTDVVMKNKGMLDKYIGDSVMAVYGAPQQQEDHAIRACRSALNMLKILNKNQNIWTVQGIPVINIGIGINTGEMVVGNIGSDKRFDYTVMGDHVNIASRLEELTKNYTGVNIIVSEFTQEKAKERFVFEELGEVQVRGREKPIKIYALLSYK